MSIHIGPYTFDRVRYDPGADVLYLSIGDPARAVDFDETPDGHALGLDDRGELVGLTIVDAHAVCRRPAASWSSIYPCERTPRTSRTPLP